MYSNKLCTFAKKLDSQSEGTLTVTQHVGDKQFSRGFSAISGFVRFLYCRKQIGYSLRAMTKSVLLPVLGMTVVALPLPIIIKYEYFKTDTLVSFIILCLISVFTTFLSAWFVGLNALEKNKLLSMVKNKIHKR